jgi:hypothetical protein
MISLPCLLGIDFGIFFPTTNYTILPYPMTILLSKIKKMDPYLSLDVD